jgi:hypothetical protein
MHAFACQDRNQRRGRPRASGHTPQVWWPSGRALCVSRSRYPMVWVSMVVLLTKLAGTTSFVLSDIKWEPPPVSLRGLVMVESERDFEPCFKSFPALATSALTTSFGGTYSASAKIRRFAAASTTARAARQCVVDRASRFVFEPKPLSYGWKFTVSGSAWAYIDTIEPGCYVDSDEVGLLGRLEAFLIRRGDNVTVDGIAVTKQWHEVLGTTPNGLVATNVFSAVLCGPRHGTYCAVYNARGSFCAPGALTAHGFTYVGECVRWLKTEWAASSHAKERRKEGKVVDLREVGDTATNRGCTSTTVQAISSALHLTSALVVKKPH